jgi:hypothetical protein
VKTEVEEEEEEEPRESGAATVIDDDRYVLLYDRYCRKYDAADTTLPEGIRLRRRRSAPRLSAYPKIAKAVAAMARRGERRRVLATLEKLDTWMTHCPTGNLSTRRLAEDLWAGSVLCFLSHHLCCSTVLS